MMTNRFAFLNEETHAIEDGLDQSSFLDRGFRSYDVKEPAQQKRQEEVGDENGD